MTSTRTKRTTRKKAAAAAPAPEPESRTCPRCGVGEVLDDFTPCSTCGATPSGFMRVAWQVPRAGM